MLDVVDYFSRDGRSIGRYCHIGVNPATVVKLLEEANVPRDATTGYIGLHRRILNLKAEGLIKYSRVDEEHQPIFVNAGSGNRVQFVPIGPDPGLLDGMTFGALEAREAKQSLNTLSLVLVLEISSPERSFNVLLPGDAETDGVTRALAIWAARAGNDDGNSQFGAVKIPHHGSAKSHSEDLCDAGSDDRAGVAAISVGTKYRTLPDREVMRAYLERGWDVLLTTKRLKARRRHFAVELSGRATGREASWERQNIGIQWDERTGASWGPPAAAITPDELSLYDTAINT